MAKSQQAHLGRVSATMHDVISNQRCAMSAYNTRRVRRATSEPASSDCSFSDTSNNSRHHESATASRRQRTGESVNTERVLGLLHRTRRTFSSSSDHAEREQSIRFRLHFTANCIYCRIFNY